MTTLFVVVALAQIIAAVWMGLAFAFNRAMSGIGHWALSRAALGLGVLMLALEPAHPPVLLPTAGYLLVFAGFAFDYVGLCRFFGRPALGERALAVLVVAGALTQGWYMSLDPHEGLRLAISFAVQGLLAAASAAALFAYAPREVRLPALIVASQYGLWTLLSLTRLGVLVWTGFETAVVLEVQSLSLFIAVAVVISGCMGQIWMVVVRLQTELLRLARVDPLTGVPNRRALDEHVAREERRAKRLNRPYAVVCFDLDRFKLLNDRYGHSAGDAALVAAARVAESTLRGSDLVARVGGEEFTILLADTEGEAAIRAAERVREALAAKPVDTPAGAIPVTASFGVAWLGTHGDGWTALRDAADQALYRAKQMGRNRVETATPVAPKVEPVPA